MRSYDLEKEFLHKDNCGKGIIYNQQDGKFDVTIEQNSSEITEHLLKVTYDELVDLKTQSLLQPGVFYRITDYECTVYDNSDAKAAQHRFDIIVLALSENVISEDARAIQHEFTEEEKEMYSEEEQHYFDNSNLAAWKLKYQVGTDNVCWAPGGTGSSITTNEGLTLYRHSDNDELNYYCWVTSGSYKSYYYTKTADPEIDSSIYYKSGNVFYPVGYYVYYGVEQYLFYNQGWYIKNPQDTSPIAFSGNVKVGSTIQCTGGPTNSYFICDKKALSIEGDSYEAYLICDTRVKYWAGGGSGYQESSKFMMGYDVNDGYYYRSSSNSSIGLFSNNKLELNQECYLTYNWGSDTYIPSTPHKVLYEGVDTRIQSYTPKVNYKGVITYMIDEWENECDYDFKNIMFTGQGTLFDPNLFYYTFVNTGQYAILPAKYLNVQDQDTPIKLQPGLYTKLDNTHFKYQPERSSLQAYKLDGYKDTYAYVINTSSTDEDTGELHYPVEIYQYNLYSQDYVRIWEDKIFYIKQDIYNTTITEVPILYCKDSLNNISEYRLYTESTNVTSTWVKSANKAWIWYGPQWGESECDFYTINLNYSNSSFDISDQYDTYTSGLLNCTTQYDQYQYCKYGATSSSLDNYAVMSYVSSYEGKFTCYIDQNLSVGDGKTPAGFLVNTEKKFSKPMKLDQGMYLYWVIDSVNKLKRIVYSEKPDLSLGDPLYDYDFDNQCFVQTVTFQSSIHDATVSNSPDCYRVKISRNKDSQHARHYLNPTICENVTNSTISSYRSEFKDCYCINGHFLDSVIQWTYFAQLDTVIDSTIVDCYMLYGTRITYSNIEDVKSAIIQHINMSTLRVIGDSMFSVVDHSTITNCFSGLFQDVGFSTFTGGTNITLINVHHSDFYNNNSYGDYYSNTVCGLVSIGLNKKSIDISEFINNPTTKRIISEDDLTITV